MRQFLLSVAVVAIAASAFGQTTITGRSNTGSIIPSYAETGTNGSGRPVTGLTFEFEFSEPSGNKYLDARETGRLRIVISNSGRLSVRNVVARVVPLASPSSVTFNDSILVGEIPMNSTRYAIFYFSAKEDVPSQILTFQIELHDPSGPVADPQLLTFLTRSRQIRRPED
ncbi:MAG: hypothetical protein WBG01_17195 [Bacteroidota bacterium]|jgi:hypothetical protein